MAEADTIFEVDRTSLVFRMIRWMHENPLWVNSESVGLEGSLKKSKKPQISYIKRGIFAFLVFYPFLIPVLSPAFVFGVLLSIRGRLKKNDLQNTSLVLCLFSWSVVLSYTAIVWGMTYGWLGSNNVPPLSVYTIQVLAVIADFLSAFTLIILLFELITLLVRKYRMIAGRTYVQFRG